MRTISWTKAPLIILFAAAIAAGCGSDDKGGATQPVEAGATCGNGKAEKGEACDKADLGGKTCGTAMMGSTGTLTCSPTCTLVTSGCKPAVGTGGTSGAGGAVVGNGGAQGGRGGRGGRASVDGGPEAGSGGTSGTDATPPIPDASAD